MIIKDDTVVFELYGKTFEFDKISFALWNLSESFELKIKEDAEKLHENQKNGQVLKVTNDGYNVEGKEQTSYHVIPWAWDNIDTVEAYIKNIGNFVSKNLIPFGITLNPNWNEISAPFVDKIKKFREILGKAQSDAFAYAAQQAVDKYQNAYNEELSRDYGLSFGILSSSLTAHLVYAAQATAKEMKDRERAENFASSVAGNPMEQLLIAVFNAIHPLYIQTVEPAMLQVLAEYYAYIVSLFANELGYKYEEIANQFNVDDSKTILSTYPVSKETIFKALCKNPSNGDVIGYAISNDMLVEELCEYGKSASKKFDTTLKEWAISVLSKIYSAGKLFNKPFLTDENRKIIAGLITYYDYVEDDDLSSDDWQDVLHTVYGNDLTEIGNLFEIFDDVKKSNENIKKYAQLGKKLVVSDDMIKWFIAACELKDGSCSWYAINMDLDTDQPITAEQVRKCVMEINERIDKEKKRLDEQHRIEAERQAEIQRKLEEEKRRQEAEKKEKYSKIKKYTIIIATMVLSTVIIIMLTVNLIIPTISYNNAMSLYKSGKYDEAIVAFDNLGGFNGSESQIRNCHYYKAISLYEKAEYQKAIEIFDELEDYEDSLEYVIKSSNCLGEKAFNSKDYFAAATWYKNANNSEKMNESKYLYIKANYNNTDETTWLYLNDLKGINYKDSSNLYEELYKLHFEYVVNDSPTDVATHKTKFKYVSSYYGGAVYIHVRISGGYPGQKMWVNTDGWHMDSALVECNGKWHTLTDGMWLTYGHSSSNTTIKIEAGEFSDECMVTVYK